MNNENSTSLRFDGRFTFAGKSESRYSVAASFRNSDPTDLELEIFWHGERDEKQRGDAAIFGNRMNYIWIPNDDPSSGHLELLGLHDVSTQHGKNGPISTVPQFSALQSGIHRTPEPEDRELHLSIYLSPSGLFSNGIFEQHYTGEIKVSPLIKEPIIFRSQFGELTLSETFQYEKVEEFGNKVTKQIGRSSITGKVTIPQGSTLYDVNEKIKDELDILRICLSLCFRQPVHYYYIKYLEVENGQSRTAFYRRRLPNHKKKNRIDELINPRNLIDGHLQEIYESIIQNDRSDDLKRAIQFLSSSYNDDLENSFFMAFSSMETILNINTDTIKDGQYTKVQWRKIRRKIEESIDEVTTGLSLNPEDLKEKLPELKRRSFRRKVLLACSILNPETSDLWPETSFEDGISGAAKLRNGLFHSAEFSNSHELSNSLIRIQTFAERLIAKTLDISDDSLWRWRDQNLKFANRK